MLAISPWYLGLIFIFLVSVIWAGSSVLVQFIFDDQVNTRADQRNHIFCPV
jgi:hypothetical protein